MSKGGFRPNSGRKKGSIPWNKGIPMPKESRQKVSESRKGQVAWNKGIPMRAETKLKLSLARKGKKLWPNGRQYSEAWRMRMSQAKLGKPSPMRGKKHGLEAKLKMSVGRRKYLLSINPEYDFQLDSKTRQGNKRIRRERIKKFGGSHTKEQWERLKEDFSFTCPSCKRKEPEIKLTRDHIVSLANKGTDFIENIQPLCNQCNAQKFTQTIRYKT